MQHIYFDEKQSLLKLLDQRHLPESEQWFKCAGTQDIVYALQQMVIRGAPAIGVTAAYGCVLAALESRGSFNWEEALEKNLRTIEHARPTAANLAWAVRVMRQAWRSGSFFSAPELADFWLPKAQSLHEEDIRVNKMIGTHGRDLIASGDTVMTHCNAGSLATGGYGTALGVVRSAVEQGKDVRVIANETRPFLQGARLTAYELARDNISVRVACDNACGLLMHKGLVHKVVVGADRIAANGDTANKIGTYTVAVMARRHGIPFYVAAPFSTFDVQTASGEDIPIEERDPGEVKYMTGQMIMPRDVDVYNYAFDVTPHELISAIITEKGVFAPKELA